MKKAKRTTRCFFAPTDWAIVVLITLLAVATCVGMTRLYVQAQDSCAELMLSERRAMSVRIDMRTTDYSNNLIEAPTSLYGVLRTADGEVLMDVAHQETVDPALGSLIGSLSAINAVGTRYVLNNYRDLLFPPVGWNAITGVMPSGGTVTLTINNRLQNSIYRKMADLGAIGSFTLYDYETGDVLVLCSTPGWGEDAEGSYINKCLYNTTPGSTQKLVTLLLLESQGIDTAQLIFRCEGSYTLPDGHQIRCTGYHGSINGKTAIGTSCNCWFAQAIIALNMEQAKAILTDLGVCINNSSTFQIGLLSADSSSVQLSSDWDFHSVWNLVGQDSALASSLKMVELAGNYVSSGHAVTPRLTVDEPVSRSSYGEAYSAALERAYAVWKAGYNGFYGADYYGPLCTVAKTGTADGLGGGNETHKLLCAVSEELRVAAYIVIENYDDCGVMPYELLHFAFTEMAALRESD